MNDIYLNKLTKYIPFLSFKLNDSRTVGARYSADYRVNNVSLSVAHRPEVAALWASPPWPCLPGTLTPSWWAPRVACCSDVPSQPRHWLQHPPRATVWHWEPQPSSHLGLAAAPSTLYTAHLFTGHSSAHPHMIITGVISRHVTGDSTVTFSWHVLCCLQEPVCECRDWWSGPHPLSPAGQPAALSQGFRLLCVPGAVVTNQTAGVCCSHRTRYNMRTLCMDGINTLNLVLERWLTIKHGLIHIFLTSVMCYSSTTQNMLCCVIAPLVCDDADRGILLDSDTLCVSL